MMLGDGLDTVSLDELARCVRGADYGEVFLERSESASVRFEDSRVEDLAAGTERGTGLRFLRRQGRDQYQRGKVERDKYRREFRRGSCHRRLRPFWSTSRSRS